MKNTVRLMCCISLAVLLSVLMCTSVFADVFTIGGTEPYRYIRNLSDMMTFSSEVNSGDSYEGQLVVLMAAIELPMDFEPIGTAEHPFEGVFDGRGYRLRLEKSGDAQNDAENVGLFGVLGEKAVVRNITIYTTLEGKRAVGAIAGENRGIIENCFTSVTVSGKGDAPSAIGWIAGENSGTVRYCFTNADPTGISFCGTDGGVVEKCYTNGSDISLILPELNSANAEHDELIHWYWSTNGLAQLTREHGTHEFISVDAIEPDCCFTGQDAGQICKICGQMGIGLALRASLGGHVAEHIDAVEPTCTEFGCSEGEKCSVCGAILSGCDPIEPSHKPVEIDEVPATETEDGVSSGVICSVCGEKLSGFEPISATGENEETEQVDVTVPKEIEEEDQNETEEQEEQADEKPEREKEKDEAYLYILFIVVLGCVMALAALLGYNKVKFPNEKE